MLFVQHLDRETFAADNVYHALCTSACCTVALMPFDIATHMATRSVQEEHAHTLRLTEHPLFVDQGKHEGKLKQFAWGCFLLGANVQQLLHEHDIVPHGQQFLLENLEKLVASARISGLKPAF